jgi:hypothetical protein
MPRTRHKKTERAHQLVRVEDLSSVVFEDADGCVLTLGQISYPGSPCLILVLIN